MHSNFEKKVDFRGVVMKTLDATTNPFTLQDGIAGNYPSATLFGET